MRQGWRHAFWAAIQEKFPGVDPDDDTTWPPPDEMPAPAPVPFGNHPAMVAVAEQLGGGGLATNGGGGLNIRWPPKTGPSDPTEAARCAHFVPPPTGRSLLRSRDPACECIAQGMDGTRRWAHRRLRARRLVRWLHAGRDHLPRRCAARWRRLHLLAAVSPPHPPVFPPAP